MKKLYEIPEIEIINFDTEDIITASGVVGIGYQAGDHDVDGSSIFG